MHIAHLVTRFLRSGSEENTVETCRWQARAGHRVTLIHGDAADPWWDDHPIPGVDRIVLPQMVHPVRPAADLSAYRALRSLFRQLLPDVIHTHQSKAGILGRMAAPAVPHAIVAHGIHILPFVGVGPAKWAVYLTAEQIAARRTDMFIGVSNAVCDAYVAAGIASAKQTFCVRSGMDLERFRAGRRPADWQRLLGISEGRSKPKVVLMLAALEPRKRHVPFLQALARSPADLSNTRLLIAGAGPEERNIRTAIATLGLSDKVILCGHRSDPQDLLHLADLTVLTSKREGLPRVVIQSLAAGRPVVMNDLPGLEEVLDDGVNAAILAPDDLNGVADRMCALLQDEPGLIRLQQGAAGSAIDGWARDRLGAETTRLYSLQSRIGKIAA